MRNSILRRTAVGATLLFVVAACGGDDDDKAGTTTAPTTAASTPAASTPAASPTAGDTASATASGSPTETAAASPTAPAGEVKKIKLQLQWFTQAQFAGYFAAVDQGFYKEQGLDVEILEGGVDIVPQTVLAQNQADYAIAWVPKALASREQGAGITNVAQIFQRSGHPSGRVRRQEHQDRCRPEGQEGRQLGLRQRVRGLRGPDQGGSGRRQGHHAGAAAVRHAGAAAG
jgi:NitT/TauT family transport system substrate-binding protein